ncbi:hypothetical protein [Spongiivirga citrea]|uniref:Uncharacterized protein n=1 Tax=Spongiivirga citrea TaxID=1481457 RepID=A0A6M0CLD7_9FLAO|nr:hypothetical protein [Spongiivirga citrea]NER18746.1 hypothetical protein [Spongiivirga citrea]
MKSRRYYYLIFLLLNTYILLSQDKLEKEYRLNEQQIPKKALDYVASFNFVNKIKWFAEESLTAMTIEAKTKTKKGLYSIEFDKNGALEDLEIDIDFKSIPAPVKLQIIDHLTSNYKRHRIKKTQLQYSGNPEDIRDYLVLSKEKSIIKKYEIVIKAKNESGVHLYEFLFSHTGDLERKSKIIFRNSDNLEY